MDIFLGVLVILFAHYMADFIFQPHSIALAKAESVVALSIHIIVYTLIFFILFCLYGVILNEFFTFTITMKHWIQMGISISIVNGIVHYLIDYITSKINRHFWNSSQFRNFFMMIGLDQFLHLSVLVFSYAQMLQNFQYIK